MASKKQIEMFEEFMERQPIEDISLWDRFFANLHVAREGTTDKFFEDCPAYHFVDGPFVWDHTHEGHVFWSRVNVAWRDYLRFRKSW